MRLSWYCLRIFFVMDQGCDAAQPSAVARNLSSNDWYLRGSPFLCLATWILWQYLETVHNSVARMLRLWGRSLVSRVATKLRTGLMRVLYIFVKSVSRRPPQVEKPFYLTKPLYTRLRTIILTPERGMMADLQEKVSGELSSASWKS